MDISRSLCPTDFSLPARHAFHSAVFLAKSFNADLVLLHVAAILKDPTFYEALALTPMEISGKIEQRARKELQALAGEVEDSVTVAVVIRCGTAWAEICLAAEQEEAYLIVIGSHGRTGLSHVLLGSVAEKVVRHASCPVLVARV
jgi:universal stress protein A